MCNMIDAIKTPVIAAVIVFVLRLSVIGKSIIICRDISNDTRVSGMRGYEGTRGTRGTKERGCTRVRGYEGE